jgi:hypothetical protein
MLKILQIFKLMINLLKFVFDLIIMNLRVRTVTKYIGRYLFNAFDNT